MRSCSSATMSSRIFPKLWETAVQFSSRMSSPATGENWKTGSRGALSTHTFLQPYHQ
jgi:hypothetical protein